LEIIFKCLAGLGKLFESGDGAAAERRDPAIGD
jgi:hypothetical protein